MKIFEQLSIFSHNIAQGTTLSQRLKLKTTQDENVIEEITALRSNDVHNREEYDSREIGDFYCYQHAVIDLQYSKF